MCKCLNNGCECKDCYCALRKSIDCCIKLGCKLAIHDSGHVKECREYKKCLCLESGCLPNKHKLPCICTQSCTCAVYHCDLKSGCCDRKPWQKCRYYCVELCDHCEDLRRHAIRLSLVGHKKCDCECYCDYECDGYCRKCDTHSQRGWNLLTWQKLRTPKIFFKQPKYAPYYFEHPKTNKQIKICNECKTIQIIMKKYYHGCDACFDTICYKCCDSYECSHTDSDYDSDGTVYWRFYPEPCQENHK